jgi:hypothetical protein
LEGIVDPPGISCRDRSRGAGRRAGSHSARVGPSASSGCRFEIARVASKDAFHLILQLEFLFFEGDFFDLFGLGEVVPLGVIVKSFVEIVMLGGELSKLRIRLQEFSLQLFEICRHLRPSFANGVLNLRLS